LRPGDILDAPSLKKAFLKFMIYVNVPVVMGLAFLFLDQESPIVCVGLAYLAGSGDGSSSFLAMGSTKL
jgi:hypothetical protein